MIYVEVEMTCKYKHSLTSPNLVNRKLLGVNDPKMKFLINETPTPIGTSSSHTALGCFCDVPFDLGACL